MITLRAPQRTDRGVEDPGIDERRRPNLRVVTEADQVDEKRSAGGVVGTLLVVLLFVCVFGVVVFQVFLVQTQSHLDQLNRDIAKQEGRTKDLRLQTTDLESPDRIVKDARERLGMIPPRDIVYLQPNVGDDRKAQFDPVNEKPPVVATAVAPKPTVSAPAVPFGPGPAVYGADGSLISGTPGVTAPKGATTAAGPTSAAPQTATSTPPVKATTPTTAPAGRTTTTSTTLVAPKPTTVARTR